MKIRWTQEALLRLFEIEDFISQDSPDRASDFVNQIIEHAESLSDNPLSGRIVPEISNPDIRELIFRKYRVVYRINGDNIDILTVFEGHRLLRGDEIELRPISIPRAGWENTFQTMSQNSDDVLLNVSDNISPSSDDE